jgi:hypothetical protein
MFKKSITVKNANVPKEAALAKGKTAPTMIVPKKLAVFERPHIPCQLQGSQAVTGKGEDCQHG